MAQLTVRLDDKLKEQLSSLARSEGKTTSDVMRMLVRQYVRDRDRSAFLENLWEHMQQNARAAGRSQEDVDEVIAQVRKGSS